MFSSFTFLQKFDRGKKNGQVPAKNKNGEEHDFPFPNGKQQYLEGMPAYGRGRGEMTTDFASV